MKIKLSNGSNFNIPAELNNEIKDKITIRENEDGVTIRTLVDDENHYVLSCVDERDDGFHFSVSVNANLSTAPLVDVVVADDGNIVIKTFKQKANLADIEENLFSSLLQREKDFLEENNAESLYEIDAWEISSEMERVTEITSSISKAIKEIYKDDMTQAEKDKINKLMKEKEKYYQYDHKLYVAFNAKLYAEEDERLEEIKKELFEDYYYSLEDD